MIDFSEKEEISFLIKDYKINKSDVLFDMLYKYICLRKQKVFDITEFGKTNSIMSVRNKNQLLNSMLIKMIDNDLTFRQMSLALDKSFKDLSNEKDVIVNKEGTHKQTTVDEQIEKAPVKKKITTIKESKNATNKATKNSNLAFKVK